ncbi:MAG TPA: hypothetical protein VI698_05790 [Nitrososphaerales archaeon]|nr:hypothetical protein [Nitrososphaerales archaeon]
MATIKEKVLLQDGRFAYVCFLCKGQFTSKEQLKGHKQSAHSY